MTHTPIGVEFRDELALPMPEHTIHDLYKDAYEVPAPRNSGLFSSDPNQDCHRPTFRLAFGQSRFFLLGSFLTLVTLKYVRPCVLLPAEPATHTIRRQFGEQGRLGAADIGMNEPNVQ